LKFRKHRSFRIIAFLAAVLLTAQSVFCLPLNMKSYGQTGTVNTDRLNLRSGPGTTYSSVRVLSTNTQVTILGSVTGNDGYTWYQVSSASGNGYIRSDFVNLSVTYSADDSDFESYLEKQGFPESYKNDLRGLHQKYPEWVFIAQKTGLDWNTAVSEESKIGRNLVYTTQPSSWKSIEEGGFDWGNNYWPGYDGTTWVAASKEIISHYMDPRNFLTDPYIFQFQQQCYDPEKQTKDGLYNMVKGTFLEKAVGSAGTGNSSYGPGYSVSNGSFSDGSNTYGPNPSSGINTSGGSDNGQAKSSSSDGNVDFIGPSAALENIVTSLFGGFASFADWSKNDSGWFWINDDGSVNANGWFWLDGNKDGVYECYYFNSQGVMASNTTIEGYTVNSSGQWIVDGKVQTKGSSGNGGTSDRQTTYADLIMEAAEESHVSPYVLAAMIIQEQGTDGSSPMISGSNSEYYGYYNFYNIAAYEHDGMSAVQAGLRYASETGNGYRPWNTVEKGIVGGAVAYGANFVDSGQDTFYLKKFNVQGSNPYTHQFMTNVIAAAQEGAKLSSAYSDEIKNSALIFRIPVFNNMPETPCELPTGTGNPNNKLSSLSVEGYQITPTFHMNTLEYSLIVDPFVDGVQVNAAAIDSKATITGTGYSGLNTGLNELIVLVTAENGTVRSYKLSITKREGSSDSDNGPSMGASSAGPGIGSENISISTDINNSQTGQTGSDGTESAVSIGASPM